MPLAYLIVIEIVRRSYFHAAGSKLRIDKGIGNHRNAPLAYWQPYVAPDQMAVTRVVRMHGDSHIAKHCFRTGGGDDESAWAFFIHIPSVVFFERVKNVPEKSFFLYRYHFQVGNSGLQYRIPIHQPFAAIYQAFAIKPHENFGNCPGQPRVHGKALARPVAGSAHSSHLAADGGAGLFLPLPHALHEHLASEVAAVDILLIQLTLDHDLGSDSGMIRAGLP